MWQAAQREGVFRSLRQVLLSLRGSRGNIRLGSANKEWTETGELGKLTLEAAPEDLHG